MTMTGGRVKAWRILMWGSAAVLFLAPAVGMAVSKGVRWGPGDFGLFAGMLLLLLGSVEVGVRFGRTALQRTLIPLCGLGVFLLVWAHLAVGVF